MKQLIVNFVAPSGPCISRQCPIRMRSTAKQLHLAKTELSKLRGAFGNNQFSASVWPVYLRKRPAIEEWIPWLYLKGFSTGDFTETLQDLVGEKANGLSPDVIAGCKSDADSQDAHQQSYAQDHFNKVKCDRADCPAQRDSCRVRRDFADQSLWHVCQRRYLGRTRFLPLVVHVLCRPNPQTSEGGRVAAGSFPDRVRRSVSVAASRRS
jgi:hypothetical protein